MNPYRTEEIDTPAGTYTVELHQDVDSENPLTDWDHEGMAFYTSGDRLITNDTLDDADRAGEILRHLISDHQQDDVTRRYTKWAAISGSRWVLVTGNDWASRSDDYDWYVLVDGSASYLASDGNRYPSIPNPESVARATMSDYRKWAAGEVSGYVVKSPNGDDVESVWGFYDDDKALEQGKTAAEYDATNRMDQANHVGAGFVGII